VIALPRAPFEPREKVPPIAAYATGRSAAWIDDVITAEARRWAERSEPTLLIEVTPAVGLTYSVVEQLLAWHDGLG
jgi:hypothetical protein